MSNDPLLVVPPFAPGDIYQPISFPEPYFLAGYRLYDFGPGGSRTFLSELKQKENAESIILMSRHVLYGMAEDGYFLILKVYPLSDFCSYNSNFTKNKYLIFALCNNFIGWFYVYYAEQ